MTPTLQALLQVPSELLSQVALEIAGRRGVLPSSLGSAEQREAFEAAVRARSVFSARTTSAVYLQEIKDVIDLALQGGYENDLPQLRLDLKRLLTRLGYTPATGFPGDAALDIPPAEAGSLQDLSSDRRINLILETQISLARGASQRQRGLEPGRLRRWPAWELVRVYSRRVPRGMDDTIGWATRWMRLGGPIAKGGRLVALKDDPIWRKLGDSSEFPDALDVEHPPFAYRSGMRWREVSREEAAELGIDLPNRFVPTAQPGGADALPDPVQSLRGIDPALRSRLAEKIRAKRAETPDRVRYSRRLEKELSDARESYSKRGVWMKRFLEENDLQGNLRDPELFDENGRRAA